MNRSSYESIGRDIERLARDEGISLEWAIEDWVGCVDATRNYLNPSEQSYLKSLINGSRFDFSRMDAP